MTVTAISEFTIQPHRRDEFVRLFESLVVQHLESMRAAGCHGATEGSGASSSWPAVTSTSARSQSASR